jgi:hypothetical protein
LGLKQTGSSSIIIKSLPRTLYLISSGCSILLGLYGIIACTTSHNLIRTFLLTPIVLLTFARYYHPRPPFRIYKPGGGSLLDMSDYGGGPTEGRSSPQSLACDANI